jgi:ribosomal-protein-alanine N-acetyltransferase
MKKALFRPLTLIDLPEMAQVHASAFAAEAWDEEALEELMVLPSAKAFGLCSAENEQKLLSFVLFMQVAPEAEILTIATKKPAQNKGYGRQLLGQAIDALQGAGISVFFLDVASRNKPAFALYCSLGFVVYAERDGYYGEEDALLMRLSIEHPPTLK